MWLTGFDAPSLHTMYVDKPMRGHGLMQAIARVNRVFRDKPGGLVVDYLGLAHELKAALATYTESGGTGRTALDQEEAVALMLEKYEVCCALFGSFTTPGFEPVRPHEWTTGSPQERLGLLPAAQEHILAQENGKDRCVRAVRELSQAFALAVPHDEALRIRDDVAFFQAVQAVLAKRAPGEARPEEELDHAVRQIISRAVAPEGVVDIFAAAGLAKPDISILSDEFLAEVRGMPQRNLAVELLQKLLKGEIKPRDGERTSSRRARSPRCWNRTIRRYQNRAIEAAQVIEELIGLAKEMRAASARGEQLGLSEDELAFYDALETNDSAVKVLGDETLRTNRPRTGGDSAQQRHDRLDDARERARAAAGAGEADPAQARLPAGQAGEGDADGAGAGGTSVWGMGGCVNGASNRNRVSGCNRGREGKQPQSVNGRLVV